MHTNVVITRLVLKLFYIAAAVSFTLFKQIEAKTGAKSASIGTGFLSGPEHLLD